MSENTPIIINHSSDAPQTNAAPQSTSKMKIDWEKVPRILGGVAGLGLLACGIIYIVIPGSSFSPKSFVFAIYEVLFGVLIILAELKWKPLLKWFRFLATYLGLGLFYLFLGGFALNDAWYDIILAICLCAVGIIDLLLACSCKKMKGFEETPMQPMGAGPTPPPSSSSMPQAPPNPYTSLSQAALSGAVNASVTAAKENPQLVVQALKSGADLSVSAYEQNEMFRDRGTSAYSASSSARSNNTNAYADNPFAVV
eukprot:TRINITY_DN2906_c0_g1_i1.p1 TRINITY_DN2906_c0_g1~~TRINITY_DN2906_c0_g1_i1.p1  ORF type:complete len:255 (+),score=53.47 TRINITY_DN2906_c0_g1_i1:62-826(+)